MIKLYVGCDLGQARDPSAIAIVEAVGRRTLSGLELPSEFHVRHLERLARGLPYARVVDRLINLHERIWAVDPFVVVDASGVGRPVVETLRERRVPIVAVQVTGGHNETRTSGRGRNEDWNVSRTVLTEALTSAVYAGRLRLAADLGPAATLLTRELEDLQVRTSTGGRERIEVATGADHHADAAFAVGLALWRASKPPPPRVEFSHADFLRR
ncbi:MAG: hypothetical protein ACODAA_03940 [Gemmatimonadota bacterium]